MIKLTNPNGDDLWVHPDNIVAVSLDRTNNPNSYYGLLTDTGVYYQFKESPAVVVAAVEGKLR